MPRPSKLTALVQEQIVAALRAGAPADTAARYAGIDRATYYRWLSRGDPEGDEHDDQPYRDLRAAVEGAQAQAELRDISLIAQAAKRDWRAAAWRLERAHPERWGKSAVPEAPDDDREAQLPHSPYHLHRLTDEEFDQLQHLLHRAAGTTPPPTATPPAPPVGELPSPSELWRHRLFSGSHGHQLAHTYIRMSAEGRQSDYFQHEREIAQALGLPPPRARLTHSSSPSEAACGGFGVGEAGGAER